MTRPAQPDALAALWGDIQRWMAEDLETYGHLYGAGYEGRKGGNRPGAAKCKACDGRGWVEAVPHWKRCEACTPAPSDPTGDVVVNMQAVRDQLGEVTERVTRVWMLAKGNRKVLRTAEDQLDRAADREVTGAELRRAELRSKDEIGQARDAKQRRDQRGDHGQPRRMRAQTPAEEAIAIMRALRTRDAS